MAEPTDDKQRLSAYAFSTYGGDAKLYNGVYDLEAIIETLRRALEAVKPDLPKIQWAAMAARAQARAQAGHSDDCICVSCETSQVKYSALVTAVNAALANPAVDAVRLEWERLKIQAKEWRDCYDTAAADAIAQKARANKLQAERDYLAHAVAVGITAKRAAEIGLNLADAAAYIKERDDRAIAMEKARADRVEKRLCTTANNLGVWKHRAVTAEAEVARLKAALMNIAAMNDLSGISDDNLLSEGLAKLVEIEAMARDAVDPVTDALKGNGDE